MENKQENTSQGGFPLMGALVILSFAYLILAGIYWEFKTNWGHTYVAIVKIDKMNEESESIWFTKYQTVTCTPLAGELYPRQLYVPKAIASQVIPNAVLDLHISPVQASTWLDFFKIFWCKFDYRVLSVEKVLVHPSIDEAQAVLSEEKKKHLGEYGIPFAILATALGIGILMNFVVKQKFREGNSGWTFKKPLLLEMMNMILGGTGAVLCSYLTFVTFSDENYMAGVGMAIIALVCTSRVASEYRNRHDYITIANDHIKYRDNDLVESIKISDIESITFEYKDKQFVALDFLVPEKRTIKVELSRLGLTSQAKELEKLIEILGKEKNIPLKDWVLDKESKG